VVRERCRIAALWVDTFHIVQSATQAIDEVRTEIWPNARTIGAPSLFAHPKDCRCALVKNPEQLTDSRQQRHARVAPVNETLYRAHLLKEKYRLVFQLRGRATIRAVDDWCRWAWRCRIPAFVDLYHRIAKHRDSIIATLTNDELSSGPTEVSNEPVKRVKWAAFGFCRFCNYRIGDLLYADNPNWVRLATVIPR
jgi:transposase